VAQAAHQAGGAAGPGGQPEQPQPASSSPVLLVQLTDAEGAAVDEPVSLVGWGGGGDGRALALAAAAGRRVFLMSLQPFLDRWEA